MSIKVTMFLAFAEGYPFYTKVGKILANSVL